ncbi:twin-arginine translocation signal domain-containing protein (plasmid) [Sinorhizobium meliloti]|nr:twin-arginine translocation signal domain-containing protein [Sinorhizobium meliloti]WKL28551.1 twin-arginine translocation signal domain-containing protein [Sinorhizobium meliloti]
MTDKASQHIMHRRTFLQASAGAAALGLAASIVPEFARASGGLVALVHTQAAGDNGPVDQMIAKLKQLSEEKGV